MASQYTEPAGRAARQGRSAGISPEERSRMIAEAAYYRAQRRGFAGGHSEEDWLEAEAEIDRMISGGNSETEKEELAAYERLRHEVRRILGEVRDTVNADTIRRAVDRAGRELREAGGYATGTVNRVVAAFKKDIGSSTERVGSRWEAVSGRANDLFDIWRDRSGTFMASAAKAVGDWLEEMRGKLEQRTYHAGEMTYGGVFECTACGERVVLEHPAHLPPCPHCRHSDFRRI